MNISLSTLMRASCTLIVAPAGARPLGHSGVAALEKSSNVACELRLAVTKMTRPLLGWAHSRRLHVHYTNNLL